MMKMGITVKKGPGKVQELDPSDPNGHKVTVLEVSTKN